MEFPEVKIKNFPTIEDKGVRYFLFKAFGIKEIIQKLMLEIIRANKNVKTTIGLIVASLNRQAEIADSIMLLAIKGRVRDSSVLLLNLFELRLDLEYIALDEKRELQWLNHTAENKKPWSVHNQLKEVYQDQNEFEAEKAIYRRLSLIKHGNKAGNQISFNISLSENKFLLSKENKKELVGCI